MLRNVNIEDLKIVDGGVKRTGGCVKQCGRNTDWKGMTKDLKWNRNQDLYYGDFEFKVNNTDYVKARCYINKIYDIVNEESGDSKKWVKITNQKYGTFDIPTNEFLRPTSYFKNLLEKAYQNETLKEQQLTTPIKEELNEASKQLSDKTRELNTTKEQLKDEMEKRQKATDKVTELQLESIEKDETIHEQNEVIKYQVKVIDEQEYQIATLQEEVVNAQQEAIKNLNEDVWSKIVSVVVKSALKLKKPEEIRQLVLKELKNNK